MDVKTSYINKYFDHVYVLNLESRPDRKVAMLQKLSRLGIKAEFVQAINGYSYQNKIEFNNYNEKEIGGRNSHPLEVSQQRKLISSPGAWGYLKTYHGILQDALKRGYERILCLDDDVLFHKDFENKFVQATQRISDDWNLIFLGASQYLWDVPKALSYPDESKSEVDFNEPYYYPNLIDGSFAMGINVSVFDVLTQEILKMDCPFDSGALRSAIQINPKKCFALIPNLVVADVSESDIRGSQNQQEIADALKWDMSEYDHTFDFDLVSVVMPAFNAEKTIRKSIQSIINQSYPSLELIVVDDASTDKTVHLVEELIAEDSRIKLIKLESNRGVGAARNEGIKASNGKIIAFQDADDISLKNRLSYQIIPLYEKGMLFTINRIYRSRCSIEELDFNNEEATISLVKSRRVKNRAGLYDYRDRMEVGLVTAVYKREVFEQYGLFDEHRFAEDLEFIERLFQYKLDQDFSDKYNGHSLLSEHHSIFKTFMKIDKPQYICPEFDDSNLTIEFQKKKKETKKIHSSFRQKHKNAGLEQYVKLAPNGQGKITSSIQYNTLVLDTFVIIPEVDHRILLSHLEAKKRAEGKYPPVEEVVNSISWKITAPIRWLGKLVKQMIPFL